MLNSNHLVVLCDELQLMDAEDYEMAVEETATMLPEVNSKLGIHDDVFDIFDRIEEVGFAANDPAVSDFKRQFVYHFLHDVRETIKRNS